MSNLSAAMRASASGLHAERTRLDVISANIANANSIRANGQDPYRRRDVVLQSTPDGVQVTGIVPDMTPFRTESDPGSPFADAQGNVLHSNVEPIYEMVNMLSASRAYEANIAAFNSAKSMVRSALSIGKL